MPSLNSYTATNNQNNSGTKFTFNFGGEAFTVQAPAGTTEAQARAVFEQQLNTGSLTGLQSGQTLNAATQLANGLKSATSQITNLAGKVAGGITSAVSKLTGIAVNKPMNVADFVKVGVGAAQKIGALSTTQVQGLMAQAASTANQPSTAFSLTQGIGKFGINPAQLESSGFLKPGTLSQYGKNAVVTAADLAEAQRISAEGTAVTAQQIANNRQIKDLLQTGTVWTGKNGLNNLNSLLSDVNSQASVQVGLMKKGFDSLTKAGVIPTGAPSATVGSLVQASSKFGAAATSLWSKGAAPADMVNQLDNLAKQGQFAVNFSDQKIPEGAAGEIVATGAKNTVNRKVLNQSITAFIGTAKVPPIEYGQASTSTSDTTTPSVVSTGVLDEPSAADRAEFKRLTEEKATLGRQLDLDDQEYNNLRSIYGPNDPQVIAARDKWEADLNKRRAVTDTLSALAQKYPALLYY
jgi:hypothetical protein